MERESEQRLQLAAVAEQQQQQHQRSSVVGRTASAGLRTLIEKGALLNDGDSAGGGGAGGVYRPITVPEKALAVMTTGAGAGVGAEGSSSGLFSPASGSSSDGGGSALTGYEAVRARVVSLGMELDEKNRQVSILRAQLKRAQTAMMEQDQASADKLKKALAAQKAEMELALNQHVGFIDRLLADKKALAAQVEVLTSQLASLATAAETKLKQAQEAAQRELNNAKETWEKNEKVRRGQWQQGQMKELRERTLKGLEPELNRMMENTKREVEKAQQAAKEELRAALARAEEEKAEAVRHARLEAVSSSTTLVDKEHASWRAKEAQLRREFDSELASLRQRYSDEIEEERRRNVAAGRAEANRHLEEVQKLQQEWKARWDDLLARSTLEREEIARKAKEHATADASKAAEDRESWERRTAARIRRDFEEREAELKQELSRGRDEQLRLVIARLDNEMSEERRRLRSDHEAAIIKVKEGLSADLSSLRSELAAMQGKYAEACASRDAALASAGQEATRLGQRETELQSLLQAKTKEAESLAAAVRQRELRLEEALQVAEGLKKETQALVQQERLKLQHDIDRLTSEKMALEARTAGELASIKKQKAEELEVVEQRVKAALRKRDETIVALKAAVQEEKVKAETAARLMQQLRREVMGESVLFPSSSSSSSSAGVGGRAGSGASGSNDEADASAIEAGADEGKEEEEGGGGGKRGAAVLSATNISI